MRKLFHDLGLTEKGEEAWREEVEEVLEKCSQSLRELRELEENKNALMNEPYRPLMKVCKEAVEDEFDLRKKLGAVDNVSVEEMAESVVRILRTSSKDAAGEELLGLLGYEAFDLCSHILSNRVKYLECYSKPANKGKKIVDTGDDKRGQASKKCPKKFPTYVPEAVEDYPFVFSGESKKTFVDAKSSLPEGTLRDNQIKYEEFTIPFNAAKRTAKSESIKIVKPDEEDPFLKEAFKGYKSLNRMQSACYPVAYGTTENMLVCAPTGAGKTDIAMLTVLSCLKEHVVDDKGTIDLSAFKIVYVAPMKALATEIVGKFSTRLKSYGVTVRECTGDTQLTRAQISGTQMLVTTPEKWDVLTRKGLGDVDLVAKVKLLIIDEVHLLHDDRGPVLESIVARTLRQVEMSQAMIRIVGLSATLPNYVDVAVFLRVNPWRGMFYFDGSFRPVPLTQSFVGVKGRNVGQVRQETERICYERMRENLLGGHQVMVFVHSRNDTVKTARTLLRLAQEDNNFSIALNIKQDAASWEQANRQVQKSRNYEMRDLFAQGLGIHHAGMVKADRLLMERMFTQGHVAVLVCTSTLAWGVNLPVHAVIIKGTLVYSAEKGDFTHIGILDVMQIFGRAGRPQFETHGEGTLITTHEQLFHYLRAVCSSTPIESRFIKSLMDNLNAEVVLGTVSNVEEACAWLGYTYFYVRLHRNPLVYGINGEDSLQSDYAVKYIRKAIEGACSRLHNCGMILWHQPSGVIKSKPLGRIASLFYLKNESVELFARYLTPTLVEEHILELIGQCAEFDSLKVREEEVEELSNLRELVSLRIRGDETSVPFKVNLLIQGYISRYTPQAFSLVSDVNYIAQNVGRILRSLFEIALGLNYGLLARRCLELCKCFERQRWMFDHPMMQWDVPDSEQIPWDKLPLDQEWTISDVEGIVRNKARSHLVFHAIRQFPRMKLTTTVEPVSASILQISFRYAPDFEWNSKMHGGRLVFWLMLEDVEGATLYHQEQLVITPEQMYEEQSGQFYLPMPEQKQSGQLVLRMFSDSFLGCESVAMIRLSGLVMPEEGRVFTELLPLRPLPITALKREELMAYYANKFRYFNPVQTQVFHTLYHLTEESTLVGAPTGSGKTVLAELAIFGSLRDHPQGLVVYIAPLKALVRERMQDWTQNLPKSISIHELSGDVVTDYRVLQRANVIVATPEKWDAVTRNWRRLGFVQRAKCIIMDEIHLLGGDRGHVLEAIVSRFQGQCRFVGLSTALANARDFARWLGIGSEYVYGFRASVRPVPVSVRMEGFPGRHYCPRMAAMNKPVFQAIRRDAGDGSPVLVFVSSRRQTRLTAQSLISLCALNGITFKGSISDLDMVGVEDEAMRFCLPFGITVHHAGLSDADRQSSERLFRERQVQVMIATSTVAWGVNFPARLVIVKGCEYYCAKRGGYVPYPITDVMQMIGRAGRPQYDTHAFAVVLVEESRKSFYKRFLYDPFPAESSLRDGLAEHLNAEVASTGKIETLEDAKEWLRTTFLAVRLRSNPSFYHSRDSDQLMEELLLGAFAELEKSQCSRYESGKYVATEFGRIASTYYLQHGTIRSWLEGSGPEDSPEFVLRLLSLSPEFADFSFRHNEDQESVDLLRQLENVPMLKSFGTFMRGVTVGSVHEKVFALMLAWIAGAEVEWTDWRVDQAALLEQLGRVLTGMIHFYIAKAGVTSILNSIRAFQMINSTADISEVSLAKIGKNVTIRSRGSKSLMNVWLVYVTKDEALVKASRRKIDKEYTEEPPAEASKLTVLPETAVKQFKLNL